MKIIYSLDINPHVEYELTIIKNLQKKGYEFTIVDLATELGDEFKKGSYFSAEKVRKLYNSKDKKLMNLYKKIHELEKKHDVFIVSQTHVYLPEFIESLNIYTVFYSADDPDSSSVCSKPYVKCYDHVFAAGVNFDEKTKITTKFIEWGAKKADWWPLGFRGDTYDSELTVEDIYNKERKIDLVFIGNIISEKRISHLSKLKKEFPQMKIFSRNFEGLRRKIAVNSYLALKTGEFFNGSHLPHNQLPTLYKDVKIGINMHWTYGPSNIRTYQLPANGIMQICDCPEGLDQVFRIGKEVVTYSSIDEAIELIKYYLENEEERKEIAAEGFKRSIKNYNRETTFLNTLKILEKNIKL